MKTVMILTTPRDSHARAVEWLLRRRGVEVQLLMGTDIPSRTSSSLRITYGGNSALLSHRSLQYTTAPDVIWRRRPAAPIVRTDMHPADRKVAEKEATHFFDSLQGWLDSEAVFNVNSRQGAAAARLKPTQLKAASDARLRIPETLISNDIEQVRRFFDEHRGDIIIKSFSSPTWVGEEKAWYSYSSRVKPTLFDNPDVIGAVPAIYQELIGKRFEVRTFFTGSHHVSVELDSQAAAKSQLDWRAGRTANTPIVEHRLPDDVASKCRKVMDALGIVTGSFDFAVTERGEYVFFEVNEQGQFLWMEERAPGLPCLQLFCDFLLSGGREFQWDGVANPDESLAAYMASGEWERAVAAEPDQHLLVEQRAPYLEDEGAYA